MPNIFVSRNLLKHLYSASAKIIIAGENKQLVTILSESNIPIEVYKFQENLISALTSEGKESTNLEIPPQFCLGFVVASAEDEEKLQPLIQWWQSNSKEKNIPPYITIKDTQNAIAFQSQFWQQVGEQLLLERNILATHLTKIQKDFYALKQEYKSQKNALGVVQEHLSVTKLPPLEKVYENLPKKVTAIAQANQEKNILTQILPIPSKGLAIVDFNIAKCYGNARGWLNIILQTRQNNNKLAQWQIPYQELTEGWFSLDLPIIYGGKDEQILLVIQWVTKIGPAPELSLGAIQSLADGQVQLNNKTIERTLAMRLWQGVPGTRQVTNPYLVSEIVDDLITQDEIKLGYLGQGALTRLAQITPNLPTDELSYIKVNQEKGFILTHPRAKGLTMAMLPFCFPAGANQITTTVKTEHPEGSIVEYAMAIVKKGMKVVSCFQENNPQLALAYSKWIPVQPNTLHEIKLSLKSIQDENCHIVIATRLAKEGKIDYCWARWLNFNLEYKPELEQTSNKSKLPENSDKITTQPDKLKVEKPATVAANKQETKVNNKAEIKQVNTDKPSQLNSEIKENKIPDQKVEKTEIKPQKTKLNINEKIQLREASVIPENDKFTHVKQVQGQTKILVHPRDKGETVAILPLTVPENTIKVTATVCTENEKASAIEYALAIVTEDDDNLAVDSINSPEKALASSGWHTIKANSPKIIEVKLDLPTKTKYHLVLATRLPATGYKNQAWARWFNFEFEYAAKA